ncbi:hypothetical protein B0T25DRAFT_613237 [Lasiosphaeria hispida]|uniref:Uncharacterized protein n=1 Tax=Lasiosphaeria hispida TaxID=260671 RepID=A0AAJ0HBU6_9PEZI|nr:hypothetical protein B0T25DRAFT_613237 [Lasiosphaeria hispida]
MKQTFAFLSGFAWLGFRSAAAAITQTEATTETSEAIVTFTTTLTIPQIEKREISKFEYPRNSVGSVTIQLASKAEIEPATNGYTPVRGCVDFKGRGHARVLWCSEDPARLLITEGDGSDTGDAGCWPMMLDTGGDGGYQQ